MTIDCDVLVIGAGPAGCSAARASALRGAKTIVIDKKREIGVPVQCAEGIGRYLFPYLPFKIPKELLIWKINGISFNVGDITINRTGGIWSGFAINRKYFDKWLAEMAVNTGANLMIGTELTDLTVEDGYKVTKATIKTSKGEKNIRPKVIIAADGVDSTVLRLLRFRISLEKTGYVLGFDMKNVSFKSSNYDHLFLGDFAPGGYGYVFPTSKTTANIGVATLFKKENIENYVENFLETIQTKNRLNCMMKVTEKSGMVAFLDQTDKLAYGNVLLVGDVANQNLKPFVEGFLPAIICGDIVGKVALRNITNARENSNKLYTETINQKFGILLNYSRRLTSALYEIGEYSYKKDDLLRVGLSTNIFSVEDVHKLKDDKCSSIESRLVKWDNSDIRKFVTSFSENLSLLYNRFISRDIL